MTFTSILTLLASTIDVSAIRAAAEEAVESGASRDSVEGLVAALIDALVPEELLGPKADAALAPLYTKASEHLVQIVLRQVDRKRTSKVPPIVQRELDRVAEAVRQRNGG